MRAMPNKKTFIFFRLMLALALSGCALDPNAGGGAFTTNAAKAYIYGSSLNSVGSNTGRREIEGRS